jgi:N-acetylglutamate synthase-like GNAT family acetyltransferase
MTKIIDVNPSNLDLYPQIICFINQKNEHHKIKLNWLTQRFKEGLKIKIAQDSISKKIIGFIEYIPGENAWRAVKANGYLFIHCIWVYPNNNKNKGIGSTLISEVLKDAKENNFSGVAVLTSDGAFMAKKELFIKNGFNKINEKEGFQILTKQFNEKTQSPDFSNSSTNPTVFKGWHILYSKQCPWVARFVEEIKPIIISEKLHINIKEITNSAEAQKSPSIYSVFNLIKDGKILADRYISTTRFKNILKREGVN